VKSPIYKFGGLEDTGLDKVPVNAYIIIENSGNKPSSIVLKDKTGIDDTTKIIDIIDNDALVSTIGGEVPKPISVAGDVTAKPGDFLLIDTTGGAVTVTLPAVAEYMDKINFVDITGNFDNNALTVARGNADDNIMGENEDLTVDTKNISFGLLYISGDWRIV